MNTGSARADPGVARSEFILGGQKSGKSRRAELLARDWLAQSPDHRAVLIATGQAWDDEMRERIARHQRDRAERVPGLQTVEEPHDVAAAIKRHSTPQTLVVVDCLTLWLTHWAMPLGVETMEFEQKQALALDWQAQAAMFLEALRQSPGPVVLVGNEIGLGVIPLGREVRAFVDALGMLNQQVAQVCPRVTLMAAGLPLTLKDSA
ncbi:adenosylcobinamide kinase /adenosylcobinamide-phosphate guanylyltransferase [Acidovorax temperans]|jgi:adenosylcobinamide kinase/adenosylcobinamide-phosphate guanylyltransferase|uniref:Bifunctional adenosylcobalamin biosynthesis protein n=1 Tax=Acidovorax temperans TaxID=80878 RepID=A0A543LIS5_9BURK|nr:bifunctional adenosylcobinamide kinase/adenosylcobinamide-phosphate guanylyltransferase [Acidovorax temperans]TQN07215.1 adenosylcobinamide kinase /adenosylcobinamide-phosphate guanylyltransferase [Acidovorax temperans]